MTTNNLLTPLTSIVSIKDSVRCPECKEVWFDKLEHMRQKHPGIVAVHVIHSYAKYLTNQNAQRSRS